MPAPRKLPFWRTVWRTYRITFGNLGYLLRISWVWLLIMVPIMALNSVLFSRLQTEEIISEDTADFDRTFSLTLISAPYLSSIGVAWLRWLLTGERVRARIYLRFDWSVLRFMPFSLLVSLIALGWDFVMAWVPWSWFEAAFRQMVFGIALSMILPYIAVVFLAVSVSARLAAVLPAKALGLDEVTLADAWRATRDNTWRLLLGTILCAAPAFVLLLLAGVVIAPFGPDSLPGQLATHVMIPLWSYSTWILSLSFTAFYGDYLLQLTNGEDASVKSSMQGARQAPAQF
jgi:hypothetical protein